MSLINRHNKLDDYEIIICNYNDTRFINQHDKKQPILHRIRLMDRLFFIILICI